MPDEKSTPFYQEVDGFRIGGIFLPDAVRSAINFKPRPGDFFVVTFPKCGTTWTQQIVNLIFNKGKSSSSLMELIADSPFLEMTGADAVDTMKGKGPLKLHLPYHLTPISDEAKYLYVVRNPKDTLVSFYHHTATFWYDYQDGVFDDYFEIFLEGKNDYEDYFDHVLGWNEHRNDPNVMFLTYEEMKQDTPKAVMKIARFMGEEYATMLQEEPQVFKDVLKYSSFEHMKFLNDTPEAFSDLSLFEPDKIPSGLKHIFGSLMEKKGAADETFNLVRKGKVGGWRQAFSEDQNRRMDEKIEKKLKGTELYDFWKEINCI